MQLLLFKHILHKMWMCIHMNNIQVYKDHENFKKIMRIYKK
jgi:hypothetical protein